MRGWGASPTLIFLNLKFSCAEHPESAILLISRRDKGTAHSPPIMTYTFSTVRYIELAMANLTILCFYVILYLMRGEYYVNDKRVSR